MLRPPSTPVVREPRNQRHRIVITQRMRRRLTLASPSWRPSHSCSRCRLRLLSGGDTTHPDYKAALKGAPAPLAKLYGEADPLLPGGKNAFERRVGELGYPVVANIWASWCGPCRFEFPMFQQVRPRGKRVAFLGVDAEDSEA